MKTFIGLLLLSCLLVGTSDTMYSVDSYFYAHASHTIGSGMHGLRLQDAQWVAADTYYVAWAPLYPVPLAVGQGFVSLDTTVRLINIAALTGILWVTVRRIEHPAIRWAAVAFLLSALMFNWNRALTDLLFLALCFWFFDAVERKASVGLWIGIAAAASLTRYTGVTVLAMGILILLSQRRWRDAFVFACFAPLPLSLWMLRNWGVDGTLMARRSPSVDSPDVILGGYWYTVSGWFVLFVLHGVSFYGLYALVRTLFRHDSIYRPALRLRSDRIGRRTLAAPAAHSHRVRITQNHPTA